MFLTEERKLHVYLNSKSNNKTKKAQFLLANKRHPLQTCPKSTFRSRKMCYREQGEIFRKSMLKTVLHLSMGA